MKELSPEQVARLRPEARERYEKRLKIVKRNRKILSVGCITISVVLVLLVLSMTVLFNITAINIGKSSAKYTADQIVMASGLNLGDNMVRTNFLKVEERIEQSLPYVKDAVITKSASGKVTINITDAKATMIVKTAQGYAITDVDGKVLEIVKEIPENSVLTVLNIKGSVTAAVSEIIVIGDSDEQAIYNELKTVLTSEGLFNGITEIDLTQKASIKLIYQNRLRLLLGTSDNLEEKIKSGAQVIEKENAQDPELIAEVNLTIPKKVYVNPLETLYPVEDEKEENSVQSAEGEAQEKEETLQPESEVENAEEADSQQSTSQNSSQEEAADTSDEE